MIIFLTGLLASVGSLASEPLPKEISRLVDKLSENCGANGGMSVNHYDVTTFDVRSAAAQMKDPDYYPGGKDCLKSRKISASKKHAIAMTTRLFRNSRSNVGQCINQTLNGQEKKLLDMVIQNPTNLAVMASFYAEPNDYPEGCDTFVIEVYRRDGNHIFFDFNYTD